MIICLLFILKTDVILSIHIIIHLFIYFNFRQTKFNYFLLCDYFNITKFFISPLKQIMNNVFFKTKITLSHIYMVLPLSIECHS